MTVFSAAFRNASRTEECADRGQVGLAIAMLSRQEARAQMRNHWMVLVALGVAACGKRSDAGTEVARAPSRSGDVWETDKTGDRKDAPATVLAFVNGLHTLVLDGSDVYAGNTRLSTTKDTAGGRMLALSNGLAATLVPAGDGLELRFTSGEHVAMRKQTRRGK
jgi:hypothetical protein